VSTAESIDTSPLPGFTHERVSMFTDAIFAIAITLLVIDIKRPDDEELKNLGKFIADQQGAFIAFVIAFVMLWAIWRARHVLFDQITRVSPAVIAMHIPLLLFAAFLPYPTGIFGEAVSDPLAISMFAGDEAILMMCLALLMTLVLKQRLLAPHANRARLTTHAVVNWGIGAFWGLTAVLAWYTPSLVPWLWMATPLLVFFLVRGARLLRASPGSGIREGVA
jgi:uncharacterized membrane protein